MNIKNDGFAKWIPQKNEKIIMNYLPESFQKRNSRKRVM